MLAFEEELVERLAGKVAGELKDYTALDRSYYLKAVAERLTDESRNALLEEYDMDGFGRTEEYD